MTSSFTGMAWPCENGHMLLYLVHYINVLFYYEKGDDLFHFIEELDDKTS